MCWNDSLMYSKLRNNNLFETELFCNIINVFTVTFDQFNVFLPDKNINSL